MPIQLQPCDLSYTSKAKKSAITYNVVNSQIKTDMTSFKQ